ncbi:MAG: DUF2892 domain-containing protein [Mycobacterium leprae]
MERMESAAGTVDRVKQNTPRPVNRRFEQRTEARVRKAAGAGPNAIAKRLAQLDDEWDMERVLQMTAAAATLTGLYLATRVSRKWLALPAVAAGFLIQHAVEGWCPPAAVWRRVGVRTQQEINEERMALRVLRGDFTPTPDPELALEQVRRKPAIRQEARPESRTEQKAKPRPRPEPGHVEPVAESGAAAVGYGNQAEQLVPPGHVVVSPVDRTVRLRDPGRNLRGVLAPYYLQKH